MKPSELAGLSEALGRDAALHIVGGWVRDRLRRLQRAELLLQPSDARVEVPAGDLDLATALPPGEVLARARSAGFRVIPTGLAHGTVTVLLEGRPVEITSFRGEGEYRDGRRPDSVTFGVGLEADLQRRDFTINALALPVEALEAPDWAARIVDPFGGRADLAAGVIRAVGDPRARFAEDGLRPLRACRFASQLDYRAEPQRIGTVAAIAPFSLDPATEAAIRPCLEICAKVSVERVLVELTKLLTGAHPAHGLRILERTGLLDLWLPELRPMVGCPQNRHHRYDVWEHTLLCLENAGLDDAAFRWALLLHDIGKPASRTVEADGDVHFYRHELGSLQAAETILRRLRASNQLRKKILAYIELHGEHPRPADPDRRYRRLQQKILQAGLDVDSWCLFRCADQAGKGWGDIGHPDGRSGAQWAEDVRTEWEAVNQRFLDLQATKLTAKDLTLDGHALMDLAGRPPGPWLGRLQASLLERVLDDPELNTPDGLRPLARTWLADQR